MSGFQTEMFVGDLAPEFKCAICLLGLKEPVQTPCGHRFCHQCICSAIREYGVCPIDNCKLTQQELHADISAKREMAGLRVQCPNRGYGCHWRGKMRECQGHCLVCPFFPGERSIDGQRQVPTPQHALQVFLAAIIVITRMM